MVETPFVWILGIACHDGHAKRRRETGSPAGMPPLATAPVANPPQAAPPIPNLHRDKQPQRQAAEAYKPN